MGVTGCGGSGRADNSQPNTLTYWASNQGPTLDADRSVLLPELQKFSDRTGIKVNFEVIPWSDLQNRILAATSSGQGPDVVNIGNTWSASLQATGAFLPFDDRALQAVGGRDRFLASSMTATGAPGQPPAAVPLYGLAYGLFYNKKRFAEAGIGSPPRTWAELLDDARKLTDPARGQWGLAIEGAQYTENAHFAFVFGRQHGAALFDGGDPRFDSPQMVAAVRQYVDLVSQQKVVNPGNAEYAHDTQLYGDFAAGRAAMLMIQSNAAAGLKSDGMSEQDYGIAPIPLPDPLPAGGKPVNSHVAGINLGVFANTKNHDGALRLVEFLTSPDEQKILNAAFGSLPVTPQAYDDQRFHTRNIQTFRSVLANTSESLPMIPQEAQFETLVGTAVKDLLADAASGKPVDDAAIQAKLAAANQQMKSSG
ncbi:sugar ABC transporter substrate-binding protein [Gandjariella thermophila]|uniref:Sugar ABC transporter substrate-binding protein n=1 Tax=Gandjariella thermophila TaxID=1931992 RepID=A0A4D4J4C7_9PSEU|nr:sugar ABC transporter substrate-binding protein [Gandjariella thermophila]